MSLSQMPGRMKAFLGMVLMGVLALSPAVAQQTSPDDNHLIVPGQRIGPIKLGARMKDLAAVFKTLSLDIVAGEGVTQVLWLSRDLRSMTFSTVGTAECANDWTQDKCRILEILVVGLEYATAEGLHVGMLEKQVRDVLGEPNRIIMEKDAHLLLYSSGILFDVNDKPGDDYQRVTQIYVRSRNCLKEVPCT